MEFQLFFLPTSRLTGNTFYPLAGVFFHRQTICQSIYIMIRCSPLTVPLVKKKHQRWRKASRGCTTPLIFHSASIAESGIIILFWQVAENDLYQRSFTGFNAEVTGYIGGESL
jgi:hypothetical protein